MKAPISEAFFARLPVAVPGAYGRHAPLPAARLRELDERAAREAGLSGLVLMERAARGLVELLAMVLEPGVRVLVLAGPGNNGGDGYGAARLLVERGFGVDLWTWGRPAAGTDSAAERQRLPPTLEPRSLASGRDALLEALEFRPAIVVDALFGTGLARPLPGPLVEVVELLATTPTPVLAVDVPSGLDADSGEALPVAVRAAITATLVAPKLGFARAAAHVGHVVEIDLGLPAAWLPPRA